MSYLDNPSVRKVARVLQSKGHEHSITELSATARSAEQAAQALGVKVGAIVKTLLFVVVSGESRLPVIALISGQGVCDPARLISLLQTEGEVKRPNADEVKQLTGFSIGGVSPLGLPENIPVFIDTSLADFAEIWSAAGHPHCVFRSSYDQLIAYTNAVPAADLRV